MEHYYAMIMAGGGGTRLWPMSRQQMPKQLLPLVGTQSMFKVSVDRLAPLFAPDHIYVVTGRSMVDALRADAPEIPAVNFIVEPYGKDNGPAAALGIAVIQKRDPQAVIAYLTADHHIGKKDKFIDVLTAAHRLALENDQTVTLGISPTYPATAFGYIRQGELLREINGCTAYKSVEFTEKPNVVAATEFLASGDYSWNSGMFIWKAETAMREFERQQPLIFDLLHELKPHIDTPTFASALETIWEKMPRISIDYAVMEGAQNMAVIPVDIGWSDVGSWASLYEVLKQDKYGNCSNGNSPGWEKLDTHDTLVYSDRLIVTIGVEKLIVVETDDVLFICGKDRAQDVKEVVNHLKTTKRDKYL